MLRWEAEVRLYWWPMPATSVIVPAEVLSPVPELPAFILVALGFVAIAGFARRK